MTEVQQLEKLLSFYYSDDPEVTDEMQSASALKRQELSSSIEGVQWFLSNSSAFSLPTTFIAAFQCFQFRLVYFPEEFTSNPELLQNMTQLLFEKTLQLESLGNETLLEELAKAQADLAILVYPNVFPQLYDIMLTFSDVIKLKFVSRLCQVLILPTVKNVEYVKTLKNHLLENDLEQQFFEIFKLGIALNNPDALYGLGYFTRWAADFSYIEDQDFLSYFLDTAKDSIFALPIIEFFGAISYRGITEEARHPLLHNAQIIERICYYLTTYNDNFDLIYACSELVSTLGYLLLGQPEGASLFELSTHIFAHENDVISDTVSGFISTAVRTSNEFCEPVLVLVVKRIALQFTQNPLLTMNSYLAQRLLILRTCYQENPDLFWAMYDSLTQQELPPPDLSAYLAITNYILSTQIPFDEERFRGFFGKTMELLFTPDIDSPEKFYPIYGSLQTFLYRNDEISVKYNTNVLDQLLALSLNETIVPEIRFLIHRLFRQYALNKRGCLAVNKAMNEQLDQLLLSGSPDLASVASLTIGSHLEKQKIRLSNHCFEIILGILGQELNFDTINVALSFLGTYTCPNDETIQKGVVDLITRLAPSTVGFDQLTDMLYKSVISLGVNGVEFFIQQIFPTVDSISTLTSAAFTVTKLIETIKKGQKQEEMPFINQLLDLGPAFVTKCIEITQSALMSPFTSDDIRKLTQMIGHCYAIFRITFPIISANEQTINALMGFTQQLMIEKNESSTILPVLFRFLTFASQANPPEYASQFAGPSLYFILCPSFNPNRRDWDMVIQSLSDFHDQLRASYVPFSESIKKTFDDFEFPSEFLQEYQLALEKDQTERASCVKDVLFKLLNYRNYKVWQ